MIKRIGIGALALLAGQGARADTVRDQGVWAAAIAIGSLKKDLLYFAEFQPRTFDGVERLNQVLMRGALGWKLSDSVSLYGGYAHVALPVRDGPDRNEERPFGQLSWTIGKLAGGTVSSRTRIEHRRFSFANDTAWRAREFIRYVHPLGDPKRPRALAYSELFWSLNDADTGARKGFDQLRTFAGLEIPVKGKTTIEACYLNQMVNAPGGITRINHIAAIALWIRP